MLSPVQTAVLLIGGIGSLAFAGWIRVTDRDRYVFVGIVSGTVVSLAYLLGLYVFTPADWTYPLIHGYRATILASVLFAIAFISVASPGTWREPSGLQRVLVGANPRRLGQWGVVGSLLLVVAAGVTALSQQPVWPGSTFVGFEILKDILEDGGLLAAAIIASPLAVYAGYRRDGLLASWILIAGPGCGTWAALIATNDSTIYFRWNSPVWQIWEFATAVIVVAVIFGTLGYLLGVVIRQIQSKGAPVEVAIQW